MKNYRPLLIIGLLEILIGGFALIGNSVTILLGMNHKSPNVLLFVVVAGCISTSLGIGILRFNRIAYKLLLFFSAFVLLTKILILLDIFQLNGSLESFVPGPLKSYISIAYHGFLLYYLRKKGIREIFQG